MRYVSIDIETTGLDPDLHQIIEFSAIIEDTQKQLSFKEIPKFSRVIIHKTLTISTELVTWKSHQEIAAAILDGKTPKCHVEELANQFDEFLDKNGYLKSGQNRSIVVAGKNFNGFDRNFLQKIPDWNKTIRFAHRTLDPANFYIDWVLDELPPSLEVCKKRSGFDDTSVTHRSLQDAWDVILLLRKQYAGQFATDKWSRILEETFQYVIKDAIASKMQIDEYLSMFRTPFDGEHAVDPTYVKTTNEPIPKWFANVLRMYAEHKTYESIVFPHELTNENTTIDDNETPR